MGDDILLGISCGNGSGNIELPAFRKMAQNLIVRISGFLSFLYVERDIGSPLELR